MKYFIYFFLSLSLIFSIRLKRQSEVGEFNDYIHNKLGLNLSSLDFLPYFEKIEANVTQTNGLSKLDEIKPILRKLVYLRKIGTDSSIKEKILNALEEDREGLFTFISKNLHVNKYNPLIILNFLNFISTINKISPLNGSVNYDKNVEEFKKNRTLIYTGKFIEYQHNMSYGVIFGKNHRPLDVIMLKGRNFGAPRTSCGPIATYNALVCLNGEEVLSFPDIIKLYEESGILLDSYIGTNPIDIKKFFDDRGYDTVLYAGMSHSVNKMPEQGYNVFILTFLNTKDHFREGIHTICAKKDGNHYRFFNNKANLIEGDFPNMEEAIKAGVEEGGLVSIIFIKKK